MKILLVSANTLTAPYPVYPLALDYLAASLSPPHQVEIADLNLLGSQEALAGIIHSFAPDLVGLSCRNIDNTDASDPMFFINEYRVLVSSIKKHTSAPVVCGGSGFTIMPLEILKAIGGDFGVIGEGERLRLLADALEQKTQDPTVIPGVISPASSAADLPPPLEAAFARQVRNDLAHYGFYLSRGGMMNLQTKRGCSFRCIYCPYPRIEGRSHRLIPPEEVAAQALALQEIGARYLFITDSAFNSDIQHSLEVARAFIRNKVSIPWGAFFAPVKLPADYFAVMAEAGLTHVEFGTESLSAAMLASYRKPFRPASVFEAHQAALDAGLHTAHYFLLGGPGESQQTLTECLDKIEDLLRTVLFFFVGIRVYPHTELHAIAMREGQIDAATDLLTPFFYRPAALETGSIEAVVRERAQGRTNWVIGSGGATSAATIARMHAKGRVGPLWDHLIR